MKERRTILSFLLILSLVFSINLPVKSISIQAEEKSKVEGYNPSLPPGGYERPVMIETEEGDDSAIEVPEVPSFYSNTRTSDGSTRVCYDTLSEKEKEVYTTVYTATNAWYRSNDFKTKDYTNEDYIKGNCSGITGGEEIRNAVFAFLTDNPQFYFFASSFSIGIQGDLCEIRLYLDSDYQIAKQRVTYDNIIKTTTTEWLQEFEQEHTDYDKIVAVHDKIIETIDYAYNSYGQPENSSWAHNLVGVMSKKGAVCEGYADTFLYFMNLLGIESLYVTAFTTDSGHAWNVVNLDGKYYPIDATWDDYNHEYPSYYYGEGFYAYFCVPEDKFEHEEYNNKTLSTNGYSYSPIAYSNDSNYIYFNYYQSHITNDITESTIETAIENAKSNARGDYVLFLCDSDELRLLLLNYLQQDKIAIPQAYLSFGWGVVFENFEIEKPIASISLDKTQLTMQTRQTENLTITVSPTNSDDRILWSSSDLSVAKVSGNLKEAIITAKKKGTAVITAKAKRGTAIAQCVVTVKEGDSDGTSWLGGNKTYRTLKLTTTVTATNWLDKKGKTKTGKVVWISSNEPIDITFDKTKHAVKTKSVKTIAAVNGKGVVFPKKPGIVYIYACDTGSFQTEEFMVIIKNAPAKLQLSKSEGSTITTDLLKNIVLQAGEVSPNIYVVATSKKGEIDESNHYNIQYMNQTDSSYVRYSEPIMLKDGGCKFTITGAASASSVNGKPGTIKLQVINEQSGKKAVLPVIICNSIQSMQVTELSSTDLSKQKNKVTMQLDYTSSSGEKNVTTDKLSIYVSRDDKVKINKTKVTVTKGATIKASLKNGMVTMTATKDAAVPAYIYVACTNTKAKEVNLFLIAIVDETGMISTVQAK